VDALAQCRGKIYGADGAAARLGLKPTTLYGKIRKLGIQNDAR
jgi:formate hydrogenlyase transcriptional activator